MTYVFNVPRTRARFFIAPWDTGAYARRASRVEWGTFDAFLHLLKPHFTQLERVLPAYSLSALFKVRPPPSPSALSHLHPPIRTHDESVR